MLSLKEYISEHTDFVRVYYSNNANTLLYCYFTYGKKIFEEEVFVEEVFTISTLIPKTCSTQGEGDKLNLCNIFPILVLYNLNRVKLGRAVIFMK